MKDLIRFITTPFILFFTRNGFFNFCRFAGAILVGILGLVLGVPLGLLFLNTLLSALPP